MVLRRHSIKCLTSVETPLTPQGPRHFFFSSFSSPEGRKPDPADSLFSLELIPSRSCGRQLKKEQNKKQITRKWFCWGNRCLLKRRKLHYVWTEYTHCGVIWGFGAANSRALRAQFSRCQVGKAFLPPIVEAFRLEPHHDPTFWGPAPVCMFHKIFFHSLESSSNICTFPSLYISLKTS